jgi:hypothetical protein
MTSKKYKHGNNLTLPNPGQNAAAGPRLIQIQQRSNSGPRPSTIQNNWLHHKIQWTSVRMMGSISCVRFHHHRTGCTSSPFRCTSTRGDHSLIGRGAAAAAAAAGRHGLPPPRSHRPSQTTAAVPWNSAWMVERTFLFSRGKE